MRFILRNLLSTFRRFKLAAVLNILGLSIAFAMFIIVLIQVSYDFTFDRHHEDYDKIFRLERGNLSGWQASFNQPTAKHFFGSSPHIVAGAVTNFRPRPTSLHIENDDTKRLDAQVLGVSPTFFDLFTFDFVEGRATDIVIPESIIIPLSLSHEIFGRESAIGRQVVCRVMGHQTVRAVYRDFPSNSTTGNYVYRAIPPGDPNHWSYLVYFRINDASNLPLLLEQTDNNVGIWSDSSPRFTALRDIRIITDIPNDPARKAGTTKTMLLILLTIGVVVILIATINFNNFNMALMPMRVKNINTQRIMGAQQNAVRLAILVEALLFFLFSWLIALLLILYFSTTSLANFLDADMSLTANLPVISGTALIALLIGLFAGLYPAYYLTSFKPALSLTGNFGLSPKGKLMRNGLIATQFVVSLSLIIVVSFMYQQNQFMQNSHLGFNKDRLVTEHIWHIYEHRDAFINQVNSHPGIESITFSEQLFLGDIGQFGGFQILEGYSNGEPFSFNLFHVHYTFPSVMGVEITAGRDFRREDDRAAGDGVFLFNETARKRYNLEVGSFSLRHRNENAEIIGFISDVKYTSFHTEVAPMAFFVRGSDLFSNRQLATVYIRIRAGADKQTAISHIQNTLTELQPSGWIPPVRSFDEVIRWHYENEIALNRLIGFFSLLAIFISIAGVFGLVVFESVCRQREIGIRKVNGASTADILLMFNKGFFKILAICFVLAAPIGWIVVSRWLENFAYRTPMYWWVFLLAFLVVAILVISTVTFQNWRVANENPVKLIKK